MTLIFTKREEWPGYFNRVALDRRIPYKVQKYEWHGCFSGQRDKEYLIEGRPFYCAYYGKWIKPSAGGSKVPQFGMHVDRYVHYYQTRVEAERACDEHFRIRRFYPATAS